MARLSSPLSRLNPSPQHRILGLIGGLILAAFVVIAGSYIVTETGQQDNEVRAQTVDALRADATQLSAAARNQELAVTEYVLSGAPAALTRYQVAVADEARFLAAIRAKDGELPGVEAATVNVRDATAAWRSDFAEPIIAIVPGAGTSGTALYGQTSAIGQGGERRTHAALAALAGQLDQANAAIYERTAALSLAHMTGTAVGLIALLIAAGTALLLMRRYGNRLEEVASRADVLNRFTEVTVFAPDDTAIAAANLEALGLLVAPDDAVVHVLNHSEDRAIPLATLGQPAAEVLSMNALSRCPGVMRGSIHVTADVTQPLSVHCPVYPVDRGTVACVPLAHGDTVGAVHLHWERPDALPLELRASVARVAEHAALAIGNRRLLLALRGQASTDARTGLANSRAFDQAVEDWLRSRGPSDSAAVLMLDLDHFKDFNDRYGHPAGDEALKVFADILRSCVRDGDVAARYGGEEFAVLLPNLDAAAALRVAERIRARTEGTIIPIGPGITDRITVSIGIALAPAEGEDRLVLLRAADSALYGAKHAGRNRVVSLADGGRPTERGRTEIGTTDAAPAA